MAPSLHIMAAAKLGDGERWLLAHFGASPLRVVQLGKYEPAPMRPAPEQVVDKDDRQPGAEPDREG